MFTSLYADKLRTCCCRYLSLAPCLWSHLGVGVLQLGVPLLRFIAPLLQPLQEKWVGAFPLSFTMHGERTTWLACCADESEEHFIRSSIRSISPPLTPLTSGSTRHVRTHEWCGPHGDVRSQWLLSRWETTRNGGVFFTFWMFINNHCLQDVRLELMQTRTSACGVGRQRVGGWNAVQTSTDAQLYIELWIVVKSPQMLNRRKFSPLMYKRSILALSCTISFSSLDANGDDFSRYQLICIWMAYKSDGRRINKWFPLFYVISSHNHRSQCF